MKDVFFKTQRLAPSSLVVAPFGAWGEVVGSLRSQLHPADYCGPVGEFVQPNVAFVQSLRKFASTTPQGDAQLVAIPFAHQLSKEVSNSLLKLIEEPPPSTYVVLLAEHPHLLPTVRSRVRVFSEGTDGIAEAAGGAWQSALSRANLRTNDGRKMAERVMLYYALRNPGLKQETILEPYSS